MKFDIIRAWKDETYRQNLSAEQLRTLPTNPAGELELTNTDLQTVSGSGGFGVGALGGSVASDQRFQSLALTCNDTAFSLTAVTGANFLSPVTTFCLNEHKQSRPESQDGDSCPLLQ